MVAPQALLTPAALLRLAVLRCAKETDTLAVLAFVHLSDLIYNHRTKQSNAQLSIRS
jgi:hypothetical protein